MALPSASLAIADAFALEPLASFNTSASFLVCTTRASASFTLSLFNYLLLGWQIPIDNVYLPSFEIWISICFVFPIAGNISHTLLEYRLGHKGLIAAFFENIMWIPFL